MRKLKSLMVGFLLLFASMAGAGEITVSAAVSLTDAFKEIIQRYEAKHPESKVWLNTGASGALFQQMRNGAPVDVFASADEDTMTSAVAAGLVNASAPRVFARNRLVVIVPADAATTLSVAKDLAQPGILKIALGNPASVPAGRYAKAALKSEGVWDLVQQRMLLAENVRQALAYVARGEVNAGIVYGTDASIMASKVKIAFDLPSPVPVRYVLAPTSQAKNVEDAAAFADFMLSQESQAVLAKYGFQSPE